jgi:hypothetical protein
MRVIYKYDIFIGTNPVHQIPVGGQILKFAAQNNQGQIWVLVDPNEAETEERNFMCLPTGLPVSDIEHYECTYIDSILIFGDTEVYHLFELNTDILKLIEGR